MEEESISASSKTTASALNALLGKRLAPLTTAPEPEPAKEKEEVSFALMKMHFQKMQDDLKRRRVQRRMLAVVVGLL